MIERQMTAAHGVLLESDQDILEERSNRMLMTHTQMCAECRQY